MPSMSHGDREGAVRAVAITPDGRLCVSGGNLSFVRVWSLAGTTGVWDLGGAALGVRSLAITPDGCGVLAAGAGPDLLFWEDVSGAPRLRRLAGHADLTLAVAMVADGRRCISGSRDGTLRLWDLASGECLRCIEHDGPVTAVAALPDGRRAVSGTVNGAVRLWDLEGGECLHRFLAHIVCVTAVAVVADGRRIASAGYDTIVCVHNAATGVCECLAMGHTAAVRGIGVMPDGRRVLSASEDGTLRLWDSATDACLAVSQRHTEPFLALALTADGATAVTGDAGGGVCLWAPDRLTMIRRLDGVAPPAAPDLATAAMPKGVAPREDVAVESDSAGMAPRLDENVQFTVYRPQAVQPEKWYPMPAFAHLSERRPDAPAGEPDPIEEMKRQAEKLLAEEPASYGDLTVDGVQAVPREGELTFVPEMPGVDFNPPSASVRWIESVHRVDFRLKARREMAGRTARGRVSVYLGGIRVADVSLSVAVESGPGPASKRPSLVASSARRYRRIFASYSHRDAWVVEQYEQFARSLGDRYLRDCADLRAGEAWSDRLETMIDEADLFQLFWSSNSMRSAFVRAEWQHALALGRPGFVCPTYWEDPLPEDRAAGLPPEELRRLHFHRLPLRAPPEPPRGDAMLPVRGPSHIGRDNKMPLESHTAKPSLSGGPAVPDAIKASPAGQVADLASLEELLRRGPDMPAKSSSAGTARAVPRHDRFGVELGKVRSATGEVYGSPSPRARREGARRLNVVAVVVGVLVLLAAVIAAVLIWGGD